MTRISKLLLAGVAVVGAGIGAAAVAEAARGKTPEAKFERMLKRYDTDKDGVISLVEVKAREGRRFTFADVDKDGRITRAELVAALPKAKDKKIDKMMRRFDADGDGAISQAEVDAKMQRRFGKFDSDHDGRITKDEAFAFAAAKQAKKKG